MVVLEMDGGHVADAQPGHAHLGAADEAGHGAERRAVLAAGARPRRPEREHGQRGGGEGRRAEQPHQPTGIRGFAPQKISVPRVEMKVTPTMPTAIERAVASPTSTGPPRTP